MQSKSTFSGKAFLKETSFESPLGGKVPSLLIAPEKSEPHTLVVMAHAASERKESWAELGLHLAQAGFTCLAPDLPFARLGQRHKKAGLANPESERKLWIQSIEDLRYSIDVLYKKYGNLPVAFIGKNFGAAIGGLVLGAETRIESAILTAGLPDMSRFWSTSMHPKAIRARSLISRDELAHYKDLLGDLKGSRAIQNSRAKLLFQFGRRDDWIDSTVALEYYRAAPEPKIIKWYDDDHDMKSTQVQNDQLDWFRQSFASTTLRTAL